MKKIFLLVLLITASSIFGAEFNAEFDGMFGAQFDGPFRIPTFTRAELREIYAPITIQPNYTSASPLFYLPETNTGYDQLYAPQFSISTSMSPQVPTPQQRRSTPEPIQMTAPAAVRLPQTYSLLTTPNRALQARQSNTGAPQPIRLTQSLPLPTNNKFETLEDDQDINLATQLLATAQTTYKIQKSKSAEFIVTKQWPSPKNQRRTRTKKSENHALIQTQTDTSSEPTTLIKYPRIILTLPPAPIQESVVDTITTQNNILVPTTDTILEQLNVTAQPSDLVSEEQQEKQLYCPFCDIWGSVSKMIEHSETIEHNMRRPSARAAEYDPTDYASHDPAVLHGWNNKKR